MNDKQTAAIKQRLKSYTALLREIENEEERADMLNSETPGEITGKRRERTRKSLEALHTKEDAENSALESLLNSATPDERAVIRMRYFDLASWDNIINAIFGAETDFIENAENYKARTFRLHGQALLKMAKALESSKSK